MPDGQKNQRPKDDARDKQQSGHFAERPFFPCRRNLVCGEFRGNDGTQLLGRVIASLTQRFEYDGLIGPRVLTQTFINGTATIRWHAVLDPKGSHRLSRGLR